MMTSHENQEYNQGIELINLRIFYGETVIYYDTIIMYTAPQNAEFP